MISIEKMRDDMTLHEVAGMLGVSTTTARLVTRGVMPGKNAMKKMRASLSRRDYEVLKNSLRR